MNEKPISLLYTTRQYPCGCRAEGSGDVPNYCPEHNPQTAVDAMPCDAWDSRCKQYAQRIEAVSDDNRELTAALQAIEAGVEDPVKIAHSVLEQPAHKVLFG